MKLPAAAMGRAVWRAMPGLRQARTYSLRWLQADLLSALTVGAMLIPQGLAYAQIVGVRPAAGLYAGVAGMLAYALFGPSRHLIIGPECDARAWPSAWDRRTSTRPWRRRCGASWSDSPRPPAPAPRHRASSPRSALRLEPRPVE